MATWATILAEIRAELKDAGTTKKWSDDLLYLYFKDAIKDYSMHFPSRKYRVTMTLSNGYCTLPSDYLGAPQVESPQDRYLEERIARPGSRYPAYYPPTSFYIEGTKLYFNGVPSDTILLSYDAMYPFPSSKDDTTFTVTIPNADEELLRLYVRAKAYGQTRSVQSSLDRFKLGSGSRDDNPLEPEFGNLMDEYNAKVAERYPGGVVRLYRPGIPR